MATRSLRARGSTSPRRAQGRRWPLSRTRSDAGRRPVPPGGDADTGRSAGAATFLYGSRASTRPGRPGMLAAARSKRSAARSATAVSFVDCRAGSTRRRGRAGAPRLGVRLTCVFVDDGLLRPGERQQFNRITMAATGIRLVTVDAADRFWRRCPAVRTGRKAQDHPPGVHPGVRGRGPRRRRAAD